VGGLLLGDMKVSSCLMVTAVPEQASWNVEVLSISFLMVNFGFYAKNKRNLQSEL